ncbi:MAG TPA: hypothetical protein VHI52_04665, partial [Verrucomicrobiae bacterium]|nr:hypothetical protein [Verrucomicrobiae bacterium]
TQYAINTNKWLLRLPARVELQDLNGTVISRIESYYDDESFSGGNFGQATVGNLTLTRAWRTPSQPAAYLQSSRAKYDAYGNAVTLLDPLATAPGGVADLSQGHVRQITYDAQFHSDPIQESIYTGSTASPLVFQAEYDFGFGTTTRSIDYNQHPTDYGYDAFGRLVEVINPGDTAQSPTTEYDYALAVPYGSDGLVNFVETRQLDQPAGSAGPNKRDYYVIRRDFTDGLGRKLMTKQEAEPALGSTTPRVVVQEATLFNARQKASRILNPYFSLLTGTTLDELLAYENIEAADWKGRFHQNGSLVDLDLSAAHQSAMAYDATLRTIQTQDPDGSIARTVYEPLVTRAYDENDTDPASPFFNTPMVHYQDGLGRLIRADELSHLNDDGSPAGEIRTWTTQFTYDLNDQLTGIVDPLGNTKSMQYDGLKRKLSTSDPDRGSMFFTYDDASNLKSTVDAKGQHIVYTYDGANRILTEDYLDEASPEFSYHRTPDVAWFYDQGAASVDNGDGTRATARNTKGMLAYVVDTSGEEHNSYDERGRVEWTIKRVPDPFLQVSNASPPLVAYRTGFQYDSMDRVTRLTYPDNDQVSYEYNPRGLL